MKSKFKWAAAFLIIAMAISACGKKGDLLPPKEDAKALISQ